MRSGKIEVSHMGKSLSRLAQKLLAGALLWLPLVFRGRLSTSRASWLIKQWAPKIPVLDREASMDLCISKKDVRGSIWPH